MGAPARTLRAGKDWGYKTEVRARGWLLAIFPRLKRIGSIGYKKSHADLVQESSDRYEYEGDDGTAAVYRPVQNPKFHLVFTRDRRGLDLVTMPAEEFLELVQQEHPNADAYVAVKARSSTWLGTLMRELIHAHP